MFDKMAGIIANRMHKDLAKVYRRGDKKKNDEGKSVYDPPVFVDGVKCNIQPYSKELAQKEYGVTVDASVRMFALPSNALQVGLLVEHKGTRYRITHLPEPGAMAVALMTKHNGN